MTNKQTIDDSASTETAWAISKALGERFDNSLKLVDTFGADYAQAALVYVTDEMSQGKAIRNPMGLMIKLLREGAVSLPKELEPDPDVDWLHARYHDAQASRRDTPAKRLARDTGLKTVRCPCGAEFPV